MKTQKNSPKPQAFSIPVGDGRVLNGIFNGQEKSAPTALFIQCFTCARNFPAADRISQSLFEMGWNLFRFDFPGLGKTPGNFGDYTFQMMVLDILAVAQFAQSNQNPLRLLIGHSLGGTAALWAAGEIPNKPALITLNSPSNPGNLAYHFAPFEAEMKNKGSAKVEIMGRPFQFTQRFVENLRLYPLKKLPPNQHPVLICHDPLDDVVPIQEATKLFSHLQHPKSFLALQGFHHFLKRKTDTDWLAGVIHSWGNPF